MAAAWGTSMPRGHDGRRVLLLLSCFAAAAFATTLRGGGGGGEGRQRDQRRLSPAANDAPLSHTSISPGFAFSSGEAHAMDVLTAGQIGAIGVHAKVAAGFTLQPRHKLAFVVSSPLAWAGEAKISAVCRGAGTDVSPDMDVACPIEAGETLTATMLFAVPEHVGQPMPPSISGALHLISGDTMDVVQSLGSLTFHVQASPSQINEVFAHPSMVASGHTVELIGTVSHGNATVGTKSVLRATLLRPNSVAGTEVAFPVCKGEGTPEHPDLGLPCPLAPGSHFMFRLPFQAEIPADSLALARIRGGARFVVDVSLFSDGLSAAEHIGGRTIYFKVALDEASLLLHEMKQAEEAAVAVAKTNVTHVKVDAIVDRGADAYDKLEEKGRSVLCKDPEVGFGLLFCSHLNSTMQLIVDRELSKKNDLMLAACSERAVANTCPGICKRLCPAGTDTPASRQIDPAASADARPGGKEASSYSVGLNKGALPAWMEQKVDEIHEQVTKSLGSGTHTTSSVSPELARMAWRMWSKRMAQAAGTATYNTLEEVAPAIVKDMMRLGSMEANITLTNAIAGVLGGHPGGEANLTATRASVQSSSNIILNSTNTSNSSGMKSHLMGELAHDFIGNVIKMEEVHDSIPATPEPEIREPEHLRNSTNSSTTGTSGPSSDDNPDSLNTMWASAKQDLGFDGSRAAVPKTGGDEVGNSANSSAKSSAVALAANGTAALDPKAVRKTWNNIIGKTTTDEELLKLNADGTGAVVSADIAAARTAESARQKVWDKITAEQRKMAEAEEKANKSGKQESLAPEKQPCNHHRMPEQLIDKKGKAHWMWVEC